MSFEDKTVLDLGCGAGILGILALKMKAKLVDFQDYVRLINIQFLLISDPIHFAFN